MIDIVSADKPCLLEPHWAQLTKWYTKNGRHYLPWRNNRSAWTILVAEVLLRRTRADIVARVFPAIIAEFPDATAVLNKTSKWLRLTSKLGFPSRFKQFFDACKTINEEYSGNVPLKAKQLTSLPGIGHYSSNAIKCFGLGHNTYLVDTNTLRIASRLTGIHIDQQKHRSFAARSLMNNAFGPENMMTANRNFALLDLAALMCKPSNPGCVNCPISDVCAEKNAEKGTLPF